MPMNRFKIIPAILAGILVLAGCSASGANQGAPQSDEAAEFLTENNLGGKSAQQVIDHLDNLGGEARPSNYLASIRANEIVFITEDEELALPLPDDKFYVSIAPFRE